MIRAQNERSPIEVTVESLNTKYTRQSVGAGLDDDKVLDAYPMGHSCPSG